MATTSSTSAPPHPPHRPAEPSPSGGDERGDSQVKSLSVPGLLAGGAAAATTSVIGGQLGISGTVVGAAITSVLSAAVVAFYTDSVNGTARKLKQVAGKAGERATGRDGGAAVHSSRTHREADGGAVVGDEATDAAEVAAPSRGRRLARIALMSLVIGLIGVAAVFGIQRISGTELSPGTGQIQRSVTGTDSVAPRGESGSSTDDGTGQQDGTGTDGTGTDGTGTDGTSTDGTSTDGSSADGNSADGNSADGNDEQEESTSEDGIAPADRGQDGDADGSSSGDSSGGSAGSSGSSSGTRGSGSSSSGSSSGTSSGSSQGAAADGSGTAEQTD